MRLCIFSIENHTILYKNYVAPHIIYVYVYITYPSCFDNLSVKKIVHVHECRLQNREVDYKVNCAQNIQNLQSEIHAYVYVHIYRKSTLIREEISLRASFIFKD